MATNDKRDIGLCPPLQLTADQIARLQEASLEILNRTGIQFFDQEAVEIFKRAGARISDGNRVHIKPNLVEWAMACAPKTVTIFDQKGRPSMELGGNRCFYGVGSDCAYLYDLKTGRRRRAILADLTDGVRIADALPNVDFIMSMVLPSDVPVGKHEPFQMAAMLTESTKPIVFVGENAASTICAVEMAEAVAGDANNLSQAPFIINYVNTQSSLHHNAESVKRLLYAAERNLPTIYAPAQTRGTVAPLTSAGAVALGNAGQLAGLVLSQLKREGSPLIRGVPGGDAMDLKTMLDVYLAPDDGLMGWDLARSQQLPIFGTAGCSDAKILDAQAASEVTLSLFANTINGAHIIHDLGYLDCAMTYCFELLALCDEVVAWLKTYLRKPVINDESLALDLIHEVAHGGSFLESEHTYQHMRDNWQPALFDRNDYDRWAQKNSQKLESRANQLIRQIIEAHRTCAHPQDIVRAVLRIRDKYAH